MSRADLEGLLGKIDGVFDDFDEKHVNASIAASAIGLMILNNRDAFAALRSSGAGAEMRDEGRLIATGWLTRMGREDGEGRGVTATMLVDMEMENAARWSDVWSGKRFEIRECSDQSGRTLPRALPLDGGRS
ncbi:hypothetical protein HCU64_06780 [Methylobacterium sp. C25]|uniref:hypothetical protein n=1 Tax=Methylobacterium sp. C25 TaxID=2721622 RepID=UPI001F16BCE7|nr:hypothetical protein [Methylobacterium sp. C25]MCE4223451.1 hypothetical protein [Methylobacterium sp. C25]